MGKGSVMAVVDVRGDDSNHFSLCPGERGCSEHDGRVKTHRVSHHLGELTLYGHDVPDSPGSTLGSVVLSSRHTGRLVVFENVDVWHR